MVWSVTGKPLDLGQGLEFRVEDGVAVLSVAPSPGCLSPGVRAEFSERLHEIAMAPAVIGAVITGAGRGFPAGPDLDELERGQAAPELAGLCQAVAASAKPIVAAMRGAVRGGGLELALAAQDRVAVEGTRISMSDASLGVLPVAGGTQRLARLIGAGAAIDLLLSGQPLRVEDTRVAGLCREIARNNVVGTAIARVREMVDNGYDADPTPGFDDPMQFQNDIAERRADPKRQSPEAQAVIDCVEAAQLLPLDVGIALERTRREELRLSPRVRGLFHIAQAERKAVAGAADAAGSVTLYGAGRLAMALAMAALENGQKVALAEAGAGDATQMIRRIGDVSKRAVEAGQLHGTVARRRMANITGGAASEVLPDAHCVIEVSDTEPSEMEAVVDLLWDSTGVEVPVCLTSNAGLYVETIAPLLSGRVMAASFQPPAQVARLVEMAVPKDGESGPVGAMQRVLAAMGKTPVTSRPENGLILQRLAMALFAASEWCVLAGAQPWEVDRALGWPLGPFALIDREGVRSQLQRLDAIGGLEEAGSLHEAMVDELDEGAAFYGVARDGQAAPNPKAEEVIRRWRGTVTRQAPDAAEIRRRVISALVSAGVTMIETGQVSKPQDIDLAAVIGLRMPRASGGPMRLAEEWGLLPVRQMIETFCDDMPGLWRAGKVLDEAIKTGGRFREP